MTTEAQREIGELLTDQPLGWADLIDQRDEALAQRDQARGMVVDLEGENAKLLGEVIAVIQERDDALLAAEVAAGTPCWRCGGAA